MGTELMRVCVKEENDEIPSIPPGFESFAAFTLKKVQVHLGEQEESQNRTSCSGTASISESHTGQVDMDSDISDTSKIMKSLQHKPWINYGQQLDHSSGDESDSEKFNQSPDMRPQLPKGVIRGCPECRNCQKVMARWRPQSARKIELEDAPVFYPTEEEFEDTLKYIASVRPKAEPYGICRIVPPPSWKPPCPLKEKSVWENSKFATRVQRVDKLQNRDSMKKMSKIYNHSKKKRRRCMRMAGLCGPDGGSVSGFNDIGACEAERFGFEPGPEFSLDTFQKYADDFKAQYFGKNDNTLTNEVNMTTLQDNWEPSVENIEGEYWRIAEKTTEEIEVLYGADLETGVFGSGFPKKSSEVDSTENERYTNSGWNLNNFPRLPGSVLSYEGGDISGVVVPWLYIGMCFSSFCWHVEDHHLYSLNYMHWGAPKIWYGVPGKDAVKLEDAMRKHLPDLFDEQPDLLHKLVTQLSPAILKSEGVPVYRCVQNPGEFVLTFPRAYHAGLNCGFNCAEAVNVAPVDWLPHGQIAIELYREQGRRTSISHDKLLLGAAREAVRAHWELNLLKKNTSVNLKWKEVCGKDGILAKALKTRVELESVRRGFLCNASQALKMDSNFDATSERECSICLFDLHLSAAGCCCSPDKYACLCHAKQLCSCSWGTKFFLFRYDINELNILSEALEGKLSAIYRWARLDLGLALTSFSKDNLQDCKLSYSPEGLVLKEMRSHLSAGLLKDVQRKGISRDITLSTGSSGGSASEDEKKPSEVAPLKNTEASLKSHTSFHVIKKENNNSGKSAVEKPSTVSRDNIILLSDDESEEEQKPVVKKAKQSPPAKSPELGKSSSSDDSLCNKKGMLFNVPVLDAALKNEKNVSPVPNEQRNLCLSDTVQANEGCHQHYQTTPGQSPPGTSVHQTDSAGEVGGNIQNSSNARNASKDRNMATIGSLPPPSHGNGKPSCEDIVGANVRDASKDQNMVTIGIKPPALSHSNVKPSCEDKVGVNATSNSGENPRTMAGSPSSSQNNLDRSNRQKGPRIAKVVRRINCNVEPLEFGVVLPGKSWCNNHAIFPKGYRSRVKYINVLDPTNMCYHVSEILDSGRNGPLFMVSLEHSPNEVFVHVSVGRCWEMVRERVNLEITKLHKLGRTNLPPLQPPGSLDGLEMFGFSSPAIVQAIEALDRNRVCADYWDSRPYSRPQGQIPQHSQSKENGLTSADQNKRSASGSHDLPDRVDTILRGLFKKANSEELNSLFNILSETRPTAGRGLIDTWPTADRGLIARLLEEEIRSRPR